jgi:hypothetical protein
MTDSEAIAAIAKIVRSRPRLAKQDLASVEARDLSRYDQIVGLITRHLGANGTEDTGEPNG